MDARPSLNELLDHVPLSNHSKIKKLAIQLGVSSKYTNHPRDRLKDVFNQWLSADNGDVPTRGAMISALKSINEISIANSYVATIRAFEKSKCRVYRARVYKSRSQGCYNEFISCLDNMAIKTVNHAQGVYQTSKGFIR